MIRRIQQFLIIAASSLAGSAYAGLVHGQLAFQPGQVRLTFEELTLPGDEAMGLAGANYLLDFDRGRAYLGLGAYGALTGQRGGFFTGGIEGGLRRKLGSNWHVDAGLFVGGGGGGSAPQGGGLMLRPHISLLRDTSVGRVGLQLSHVEFPDGDISSSQLALVYEQNSHALFGPGWLSGRSSSTKANATELPGRRGDFTLLMQSYLLPAGTRNVNGDVQDEAMQVIGVEWDRYGEDGRRFMRLGAAGALGGSADGFAQVTLGGGYRWPLGDSSSLKLAVAAGGAGGGRVDSGGGVLLEAAATLQHRFDNGLLLGLRAGYVEAPGGNFGSPSLGLHLGYSYEAPTLPPAGTRPWSRDSYDTRYWRMRLTHQSYLPTNDYSRKNGGSNARVDLLGLQLDRMLGEHLYITGQGFGAYRGGAGGYASGMVGLGWTRPWWKNSRLLLDAELLAGAGGGGGLAVGDGLLGQAVVGAGYRLNRAFTVHMAAGRIWALGGSFEANTLNLSLAYRFTTLER